MIPSFHDRALDANKECNHNYPGICMDCFAEELQKVREETLEEAISTVIAESNDSHGDFKTTVKVLRKLKEK